MSVGVVAITPWSPESIAGGIANFGLGAVGDLGSAVWTTGASNVAIFVPFTLAEPIEVTKLFAYNGTAVSGNLDIGIYDEGLTKLISTGSTAQSGTSVLQVISVTATRMGPGQFWMAITSSAGNAATFFNKGSAAARLRLLGIFQQGSALPLPATATPAALSSVAILPFFGLGTKWMV